MNTFVGIMECYTHNNKKELLIMNIRYKVYYCAEEEFSKYHNPGWENHLPYKLVRANSEDKAKEIFKRKNLEYIPVKATKY